jgi:hypothetical protein
MQRVGLVRASANRWSAAHTREPSSITVAVLV